MLHVFNEQILALSVQLQSAPLNFPYVTRVYSMWCEAAAAARPMGPTWYRDGPTAPPWRKEKLRGRVPEAPDGELRLLLPGAGGSGGGFPRGPRHVPLGDPPGSEPFLGRQDPLVSVEGWVWGAEGKPFWNLRRNHCFLLLSL